MSLYDHQCLLVAHQNLVHFFFLNRNAPVYRYVFYRVYCYTAIPVSFHRYAVFWNSWFRKTQTPKGPSSHTQPRPSAKRYLTYCPSGTMNHDRKRQMTNSMHPKPASHRSPKRIEINNGPVYPSWRTQINVVKRHPTLDMLYIGNQNTPCLSVITGQYSRPTTQSRLPKNNLSF